MADGRGIKPQYLRRQCTRACRDGGFPPIRLPDLRHTSASPGLAAGETLVEVSKRLGHSQPAITAGTYTQVLPVGVFPPVSGLVERLPRLHLDQRPCDEQFGHPRIGQKHGGLS
jgi:integrase